jgi:hypothetical protein
MTPPINLIDTGQAGWGSQAGTNRSAGLRLRSPEQGFRVGVVV